MECWGKKKRRNERGWTEERKNKRKENRGEGRGGRRRKKTITRRTMKGEKEISSALSEC